MKKLLLFISSLVFTVAMQAQIINVPADFPTIQQAIDTANTGDTVLVSPGIYVENITIERKNITVASLFLTTQDTSYISQTILDGNQAGSVVRLFGVYTTMVLSGFTIKNGNASSGGGILITSSGGRPAWNSTPTLRNLIINDNSALAGGGICCSPGGSHDFSSYVYPYLQNVTIKNNTALYGGGMMFGSGYGSSGAQMLNVTISDNAVSESGGGIYLVTGMETFFKNVTLKNNRASNQGGGIYFAWCTSVPVFDSIHRCNIYLNSACEGNDLFYEIYGGSYFHVFKILVDTFSVINPTGYHASPLSNFSFNILHGFRVQVSDLYVSPMGDDTNTGLTAEEPLKTIHGAFSFILSDPVYQNTIHLLRGVYSPSTNEELFPLNLPDYISLEGVADSLVVINADSTTSVIQIKENNYNRISGLKITGGSGIYGGGISCFSSKPILENVAITGNIGNSGGGVYFDGNSNAKLNNVTVSGNIGNSGGGIYLCGNANVSFNNVTISGNSACSGGGVYFDLYSKATLNHVIISENSASSSGGGITCSCSNLKLEHLTISANVANERGGGIYCDLYSRIALKNTMIIGNSAGSGGGIYCHENTDANLENVIITANVADDHGGGIYCDESNIHYYSRINLGNVTMTGNSAISGGGIYCDSITTVLMTNTIMWNDSPQEIVLNHFSDEITISFSDTQGGEAGIVVNGIPKVNWLEGNINEDPLFAGNGEHPYLITAASSCRNTGTPDTTGLFIPQTDLAGGPRIWDGRIDMGAYEWNNVGKDELRMTNDELRITNWPNPFVESTAFGYMLNESSQTSLQIFDSFGQLVAEPVNAFQQKGDQKIEWNSGSLPSGIYYYRIQAGKYAGSGKMVKY